MKYRIYFLLFIVMACHSKAKNEVIIQEIVSEIEPVHSKLEFNLRDTVLKNINLKKENCNLDLIAQQEHPTNPQETIFAIPEISKTDANDDSYFEYTSHIVIVDTKSGTLKHKYSEGSKTNGWTSDAIQLAEIKIDTMTYALSEHEQAFGVNVSYHNNSQPNPYSYQTISLYKKQDDTLVKILNNYTIKENQGETDTVCYGDFINQSKTLIMSPGQTNGYSNILVKNTITTTKSRPNTNGLCRDTSKVSTEVSTLRFSSNQYKASKAQDFVIASIDSVAIAEIKQYAKPLHSIYEYYNLESEDKIEIWSGKLFGRCCSEADVLYSEILNFKISATVANEKFTDDNLSDLTYRTAFEFKEEDHPKITLRLLKNSENHVYHTYLHVDDVLTPHDTILNPFTLSLVNGSVLSEASYFKNGRIKTMAIYLNKVYKNTILLQDTPLVQSFSINVPFFKDDVITLIPQSYYYGTTYNTISIAEIQSSLAQITHPSINRKYKIRALQKK
ncbi:hypothetical protein HNV08_08320 [Winogradskyella eckloniae]|uniref:NADase-type glycan-binding domain-containing protein n=1 Tax=Winogradskyella eckloniae TaxID=1089306 RepID=UPI0015630529|nr:hypothetical protein [Winogradskyella eckloniae]NRD20051.1 hypothetical protein [Winogradskyella eckloniae]